MIPLLLNPEIEQEDSPFQARPGDGGAAGEETVTLDATRDDDLSVMLAELGVPTELTPQQIKMLHARQQNGEDFSDIDAVVITPESPAKVAPKFEPIGLSYEMRLAMAQERLAAKQNGG